MQITADLLNAVEMSTSWSPYSARISVEFIIGFFIFGVNEFITEELRLLIIFDKVEKEKSSQTIDLQAFDNN